MEAQRKKLDPLVIRFIATTLILANGSTTTLDVKKSLRQRGYEARQADVSQWLLVICFWENWAVKDNGKHRIYSFPKIALPLPVNN
ncbi:hypothetical protein GO730_15960 [Spirosoma sp. HMF3257]|uniref:Uncharacterized protein n=1 Tax=Spirosoma telluris TaxID=2183553 RepID=A0A327NJE6_9BACT|nr:hypothetical protein [Spirosoma telluris]RAI75297.1 hypothetical protein HMF3257_15910 [Spirosoma telluris]